MSVGPGTLVDAGFIDEQGKITPKAKKEFIRQLKEELKNGSNSAIFPCGIKLEPNPEMDLNLEDEKLFPEFHKNIFKNYEQIAKTINVQGNFSILPICDPLALAAKIKPDLKLDINFKSGEFLEYVLPNLPALALKLEFDIPIDLAAKFPSLLNAVPKIEIPLLPSLDLPDLLQFPELYKFNLPALKVPELFLGIVAKIPTFAVKIASVDIPSVFTEICKLVNEKAFPPPTVPDGLLAEQPPPSPSNFPINVAAANVTSRMMTSMLTATAVGVTMGSAPDGLVGAIGVEANVKEEPEEKQKQPSLNIRDKIAAKALRAVSKNHGGQSDGLTLSYYGNREEYAKFLLYTECGSGEDKSSLSKEDPNYDPRVIGIKRAVESTKLGYSSCGMFARACYWSAGASVSIMGNEFGTTGMKMYRTIDGIKYYYNFFTDEYRGFDLPAIEAMARKMGAIKYRAPVSKFGPGITEIKKGDLFFIRNISEPDANHICVAISDWDGESVQTVEGGQDVPIETGYTLPGVGRPNYRSIRRYKYYDKNLYSGSRAGEGKKDNEWGRHRQINFRNGKPYSLGMAAKNYVAIIIDAELFVNNKEFSKAKNPKFEENDISLARTDESINQKINESLNV